MLAAAVIAALAAVVAWIERLLKVRELQQRLQQPDHEGKQRIGPIRMLTQGMPIAACDDHVTILADRMRHRGKIRDVTPFDSSYLQQSVERTAADVRHMLEFTNRQSWGTFIVHADHGAYADEYFAAYRDALLQALGPLIVERYDGGVVLSNGRRRVRFDIGQDYAAKRLARLHADRIRFTGVHAVGQRWVTFEAVVDRRRVSNRVSREALSDYFGSDGTSRGDAAAYVARRPTIDAIAQILIARGDTNRFGGADIDTNDVERYGQDADALAPLAPVLPFKPAV